MFMPLMQLLSDCVHLALCGFIKESIDLVVTGINFGGKSWR